MVPELGACTRGEDVLARLRRDVETLPPLPEAALAALRLTRDPEASAGQLAEAIGRDQALTAETLRLCNSALYGLPRAVASVNQGIMYLGFGTVRTLILTSALREYMRRPLECYGYAPLELYRHGVAVGVAARLLVRRTRRDWEEAAYTAGLLHDVGKAVLHRYLKPWAEAVRTLTTEEGLSWSKAEQRLLGIDHAEIGGDVAAHWNFPEQLAEAIRRHHAPAAEDKVLLLAAVVHVADAAVHALDCGPDAPPDCSGADARALSLLGFDAESYAAFCGQAGEELARAGALLT